MNYAAINMSVEISVQVHTLGSFGHVPRSEVGGSRGNHVFDHMRNCRPVFPSSCTGLHSQLQCIRVPVSPQCPRYLLFSYFFTNSHPNEYEVIFHCSFDLHFPND